MIDELGIQDRTIFCSPVGCSVFAYYYLDVGNIQCSHGRAPAVATGIRRTLKDAILICYQGDGDLAGIGTTEIIHAANRGENITVFFINNAIYGMTGGQMAPTTILGQKTITSPTGRSMAHDGNPIGMAEIIAAIKTPVYIERVSLGSPDRVLKTRKAIKQALVNQIQKKGFSFVEILSPCPVNWRMEPVQSRQWLIENLEPVFPVRKFRDASQEERKDHSEQPGPWLDDKDLVGLFEGETDTASRTPVNPVPDQYIKISGFGGQGVMSAGVLLANCVIREGLNAAWLPSYGPEMRGGTANASVIVSAENIGSPVVDYPNVLIAMNLPSLDAFEESVLPGGMIIVNSSIIPRKVQRQDVTAVYVPASELASQEGLITAATVIVLTVYILISKAVSIETVRTVIPLSLKNKKHVAVNLKIVQRAEAFYEEIKNSL
jgi:2-oxoisovalerate ferredoxin oxidoreductase beta subunit